MLPIDIPEPNAPQPTSRIDPRRIKSHPTYTHSFTSETIQDFGGPKLVKRYVHTFDLEIDPDPDLSGSDVRLSPSRQEGVR